MRNHVARKSRAIRSTLAVCLAFLLTAKSGIAGEIPREFLEQYQPFAQRGLALYSQVTLEGSIIRGEGNQLLWRNFICRHDGKNLRLDLTYVPSPYSQGVNGETQSEVYIASPHGSLRAEQASAITKIVVNKDSPADYPALLTEIYNRTSVVTPYRCSGLPIVELLRSPRVTVNSIGPVSQDGRELVEIKAQGKSTEPSGAVWDTTVLLSPAEGWVVRQWTESDEAWVATQKDQAPNDRGMKICWTLDYDGMNNGIAILKSIEYQQWRGKPTPSDVRFMDVERITFGPSSARDFALQNVGTEAPISRSQD